MYRRRAREHRCNAGGDRLRMGRPEVLMKLETGDVSDYGLHPDGRIMIRRDLSPQDSRSGHVIVGRER